MGYERLYPGTLDRCLSGDYVAQQAIMTAIEAVTWGAVDLINERRISSGSLLPYQQGPHPIYDAGVETSLASMVLKFVAGSVATSALRTGLLSIESQERKNILRAITFPRYYYPRLK